MSDQVCIAITQCICDVLTTDTFAMLAKRVSSEIHGSCA